jgi:ATP-dependent Clp protease ATP-binding subunit ClpA
MFERYTERARRVVFFARYEASALQASWLDTEHLLLGLLREGHGIAAEVLAARDITHAMVWTAVEKRGKAPAPVATSVDMPLSAQARLALQHAAEEADALGVSNLDTEHLLLGLLRRPDCVAASILASKGLRLEELRDELRLRSSAKALRPRAGGAFSKLARVLRRLEDCGATYHVCAFTGDAIRVEIGLPEEKLVASFFPDGRVVVQAFVASGAVQDEDALDRLLDRLDPPERLGTS